MGGGSLSGGTLESSPSRSTAKNTEGGGKAKVPVTPSCTGNVLAYLARRRCYTEWPGDSANGRTSEKRNPRARGRTVNPSVTRDAVYHLPLTLCHHVHACVLA
ncbi:hypothetical protein MRX96_037693 [Rhipicephalus microplus]